MNRKNQTAADEAERPVEATHDQAAQHEAQLTKNVAKLEVQKAGELPEGAAEDLVAPFVLRGELHTNLTEAEVARRWPQDADAIIKAAK